MSKQTFQAWATGLLRVTIAAGAVGASAVLGRWVDAMASGSAFTPDWAALGWATLIPALAGAAAYVARSPVQK